MIFFICKLNGLTTLSQIFFIILACVRPECKPVSKLQQSILETVARVDSKA